MITGKLADSLVKVWDKEDAEEIYEKNYYGKYGEDGSLELSLSEAMHLVDRELLEIERESKVLDREEVYEVFAEKDSEFDFKYKTYSDLRERGYIVKSGFKFGAHFRVYPRGANPYQEGEKRQKDHTKWIVHAVPENEEMSFQEVSRAVRLAHNIRATMLWGVVDSEGGVTYYEVEHTTP